VNYSVINYCITNILGCHVQHEFISNISFKSVNIPENDSEPHLQQISGFLQNMFVKKLDISDLFILLTNNKSL
jgi:hypothetical protein